VRVVDLGPGESHSDSIWIADDGRGKVVFAGDVVFNGEHSYLSDGHSSAWLANLEKCRALFREASTIYPGHGPAADASIIDREARYLQLYRWKVRELAAGESKLTEAGKERLSVAMIEHLPQGRLTFLIPLGADPVAAELAAPVSR